MKYLFSLICLFFMQSALACPPDAKPVSGPPYCILGYYSNSSSQQSGAGRIYNRTVYYDVWGAWAQSLSTGRVGIAYNESSKKLAKQYALEACGVHDCEATTFRNGYAALVQGKHPNTYSKNIYTLYYAINREKDAAITKAMQECKNAGSINCTLETIVEAW